MLALAYFNVIQAIGLSRLHIVNQAMVEEIQRRRAAVM